MPKSVSILITNRNSFDAIQLCVESIRKHTEYLHKIIVYDEHSTNEVDRAYLRAAHTRGWIELIEENRLEEDMNYDTKRACHPAPYWHGKALNILVNGACAADLAIVMDCDTCIKEKGWLEEAVSLMTDEELIAVVHTYPKRIQNKGGYVFPVCDFSFGVINMIAYRDNMWVDWIPTIEDRRKEPYASFFADVYPPEKTEEWKSGRVSPEHFNRDIVHTDPGSKFYMKATWDNPKNYKILPIPPSLKSKYYHFGHISVHMMPREIANPEYRNNLLYKDQRFLMIREELKKIREA